MGEESGIQLLTVLISLGLALSTSWAQAASTASLNDKTVDTSEDPLPELRTAWSLNLYGRGVSDSTEQSIATGVLGTAGDRHTLKGVVQNNKDYNASVGDASVTMAFTALQDVNEGGPGVNSILGF